MHQERPQILFPHPQIRAYLEIKLSLNLRKGWLIFLQAKELHKSEQWHQQLQPIMDWLRIISLRE
ncbi:hypothetical protein ACU11_18840 [Xanthomonas oryzae pv. oryzicola]|nr:hypothetical protein ACU11_18840 [Xanthomonas oryzae pv. oryzicola]PUE89407.1 hypothetical protein C7T79_22850 [Xanthomonas oryzae pv. oryzicola]